jgi:hypothetical protein
MQVYPSGRTLVDNTGSRQLAVLRRLEYLTVRMIFAPDQAKRRRGKRTEAEPSMSLWTVTVMAHRTHWTLSIMISYHDKLSLSKESNVRCAMTVTVHKRMFGSASVRLPLRRLA